MEKSYAKRREQIKSLLFTYAHFFARKYDAIYIGDYTPSPDLHRYQSMNRAMLNQTPIGKFRSTLEWVQTKHGQYYEKVCERDTTKTCCHCGHQQKKAPSVRRFTCSACGETSHRDLNSVINIGAKVCKLLPRSGYVDNPTYTVWWDHTCHQVVQAKVSTAGGSKNR